MKIVKILLFISVQRSDDLIRARETVTEIGDVSEPTVWQWLAVDVLLQIICVLLLSSVFFSTSSNRLGVLFLSVMHWTRSVKLLYTEPG